MDWSVESYIVCMYEVDVWLDYYSVIGLWRARSVRNEA